MKLILAFILSLIVITETVIPCCLWDNCSQEEIASSQSKQKQSKGDCSPFAACASCVPAVLVAKPFIAIAASQQLMLEHTVTNKTFTLSSFHYSLLQPPRLS